LQKYKPITTEIKACEICVEHSLLRCSVSRTTTLRGRLRVVSISYMNRLPPYYKKRKAVKIHS